MMFVNLPDAIGESGRYVLGPLIGQGGMGAVYQAWDDLVRAPRAVKVLFPPKGGDASIASARFVAEGNALMRIDHPNVVRVYDVGSLELGVEGGPVQYMVMELCEGGSPADWVVRYGPMSPRMAVDVVLQLCDGLEAIHATGLIHRDVKPANVLVSRSGVCKLADFGVARLAEIAGITATSAVFGTLGFMAPEQRRSAKGVDARADVYAAAATLHSLLTDRFEMDLFAWAAQPDLLAGIPEVLLPIMQRAVAYRVDKRTPSIAALASELRAMRASLPPIPKGAPPLARPRTLKHPHERSMDVLHLDRTSGFKRQRTILLVEDDPAMRELAEVVLNDIGFRVMSAEDGAEAMRVSDAFDGYFDLVITDLVMPGQSGAQVAGALRRARPGLRVLFMSAYERDRLATMGIDLGHERLLQKPFSPDELILAIRAAVDVQDAG